MEAMKLTVPVVNFIITQAPAFSFDIPCLQNVRSVFYVGITNTTTSPTVGLVLPRCVTWLAERPTENILQTRLSNAGGGTRSLNIIV
jgi:hypothetical protein